MANSAEEAWEKLMFSCKKCGAPDVIIVAVHCSPNKFSILFELLCGACVQTFERELSFENCVMYARTAGAKLNFSEEGFTTMQ